MEAIKCLVMLDQWQCPDSPLGLGWEFPVISLCLKLNVEQMQTLDRQSSSVFCSDIHLSRNQRRFSFDFESKEVGKKLPRVAILFLYYITFIC